MIGEYDFSLNYEEHCLGSLVKLSKILFSTDWCLEVVFIQSVKFLANNNLLLNNQIIKNIYD